MTDAASTAGELSFDEYWALVERDVLTEAKVELVDGHVVSMSPMGPEQQVTIRQLMVLLRAAIEELEVQMPLRLPPRSAPEPDLALTEPPAVRPAPDQARLVIEVVWSQWDEAMRKLPVYAGAGIAECWIVDIPKRLVHVHDQPSGREYARTRTLAGSDVLEPPSTDIRFTVADVFALLDEPTSR
jgi:Uma2 family endonuclease